MKKIKLLFTALLSLPTLLNAAPKTWVGATNDLGTAANWSPAGVPGATDTGIFTAAGNHSPELSSLSPTSSITVSGFLFNDTITPYTITVTDPGAGTADLNFSGSGVTNLAGLVETFQTTGEDTTINFRNSASADTGSTGLTTYNINGGSFAILNFFDTSGASNANINGLGSTFVIFNDSSKSESAQIHLEDFAALDFYNTSIAGSSASGFQTTITGTDSSFVQFNDTSDPNNAIINLHDTSSVEFATTAAGTKGGPLVTLFDSATMTVTNSVRLRSLNSDSTSTTVSLGTQTLTMHEAAGMNDVYAGAITGTGTLRMDAVNQSGTLTLTGVQNPVNTWDADVLRGTLIGNTDNLNRTISVSSPGVVEFNQQSNGTFTGSITGDGTLIKAGPANLVIGSDNSAFAGTTKIVAGNLVLNNQLGGTIKVFSILSGTGIANGTVIVKNGGVITPANFNIGTLTVGDYIHQDNGYYYAQVRGSGASDLIHATSFQTNGNGTATLHGGTVFAASANGTFLVDHKYTIVTADGGVFGKYARAQTDINPYLAPRLVYDPHHVYLILGTDFESQAQTHNQRKVSEQIDSIEEPGKKLQEFLHLLLGLTPSELRQAFDELSGVQYAAMFPSYQKANERFIRDVRLGVNTCDNCRCGCGYELWGDIEYGRSYTKGDSNAHGYKEQNINGFLASNMQFNSNFSLGAGIFYENDIIRFNLNGKDRSNIILGSIYSRIKACEYYLFLDFVGGYSHHNVRRHIDIAEFSSVTKAHPKIYNATGYAELGVDLNWCGACLQPFVAGEFGYYHLNQFKENDGEPVGLKGKNQNYRSYDSYVGLRARTPLGCGFSFIAEGAWQHRYHTNANQIKLEFQRFGEEFTIWGPKQTQDAIVGSLVLSAPISNIMTVFVDAYGEKWKNYSTYSFGIGLDLNW